MIKCSNQSHPGRKGVIWLILAGQTYLRDVSTRNSWTEAETRFIIVVLKCDISLSVRGWPSSHGSPLLPPKYGTDICHVPSLLCLEIVYLAETYQNFPHLEEYQSQQKIYRTHNVFISVLFTLYSYCHMHVCT